jgi:hypothetical protein
VSLQGAGDLAVGLFEMPPEWMSRPLTRVDREVEAETGPPIMRICNLGDGNRSDLESKQDQWRSNLEQELIRLGRDKEAKESLRLMNQSREDELQR